MRAVGHRLDALARRRGAAGLQYVVYRDGAPWLQYCRGIADMASSRHVRANTCFNGYSLTKPLTACVVLCLAAQGRLRPDDPLGVAVGVEGLESYGTVRDALLHRAGLRNPYPLRWVHLPGDFPPFDEAAFVDARIQSLRGTRRSRRRSGYSNLGYLLLGRAVERAAGARFTQAAHDELLRRLAFGTDESLDFTLDVARHARGHLRRVSVLAWVLGLLVDRQRMVEGPCGQWLCLRRHVVDGPAYGGIFATAGGLARFGQAVLGCSPGIPLAVREAMLTVVPGPGPIRSPGFFHGMCRNQPWFGHAGGGLGGYGEMRLYPRLAATSVLLTNGPGLSDARCLDDIDALWLDGLS